MDCCIGGLLIGSTCMLPPAPNLTLLVFCMHWVYVVWNQTLYNVNERQVNQDRKTVSEVSKGT